MIDNPICRSRNSLKTPAASRKRTSGTPWTSIDEKDFVDVQEKFIFDKYKFETFA